MRFSRIRRLRQTLLFTESRHPIGQCYKRRHPVFVEYFSFSFSAICGMMYKEVFS